MKYKLKSILKSRQLLQPKKTEVDLHLPHDLHSLTVYVFSVTSMGRAPMETVSENITTSI